MPIKTLDEYLKQTRITGQQPTKQAFSAQTTNQTRYKIIGFYREAEFQETPIGKIPKQWKIVRLKDVTLVIRNGLTYKEFNKEGKGYPVTRIETISDGKMDVTKVAYIENISAKDLNKYRLQVGDILFSHINSVQHLGKTAIYEGEPEFLLHGMNLLLIRPDTRYIYPRFLLYLLQFYKYKNIFVRMAKRAVNQASINQTQLGSLKTIIPPLEEQWGIAEVLSTVDRAIEETERLIERLERLKKALMQELLTKEIGHKEFKDTPIGKIPKEWKIVNLGDIGSFQYGITISAQSENTGIKLLRITDIKNGRIDWDNMPYCKVSKRDFKRYKVNIGDILFARIGATTGKTCYVDRDEPAVFGSYLIRFIPSTNEIDTKYLYYFTQSAWYWVQVDKLKGGQLKKGLNTKLLAKIKIPLPQLEEQRKIANILSSVDEWIMLEMKSKEKFERLKRGLLELLLTGRVRVRVERVS